MRRWGYSHTWFVPLPQWGSTTRTLRTHPYSWIPEVVRRPATVSSTRGGKPKVAARITITPTTMIPELLQLFPPQKTATDADPDSATYDWQRLMLVRVDSGIDATESSAEWLEAVRHLEVSSQSLVSGTDFWATAAVYELYYPVKPEPDGPHTAFPAESRRSSHPLGPMWRHVGQLHAIPGLPQPLRNTECTDTNNSGTVISLTAYLHFVCHTFTQPHAPRPRKKLSRSRSKIHGAATSQAGVGVADVSTSLFARPIDTAENQMSRRRTGTTPGAPISAPHSGIALDSESFTHISADPIGVLLLLEREWVFLSFCMHVFNPLLCSDNAALCAAQHSASCSLTFLQAPTTQLLPEDVAEARTSISDILSGRNTLNWPPPQISEVTKACHLAVALPQTILVHRSGMQNCWARPSDHWQEGRSLETVEERQNRCLALLRSTDTDAHSPTSKKEGHGKMLCRNTVRPPFDPNQPVTISFSVFPSPQILLRNTRWKMKPFVLAEEMRYGLLLRYKEK